MRKDLAEILFNFAVYKDTNALYCHHLIDENYFCAWYYEMSEYEYFTDLLVIAVKHYDKEHSNG